MSVIAKRLSLKKISQALFNYYKNILKFNVFRFLATIILKKVYSEKGKKAALPLIEAVKGRDRNFKCSGHYFSLDKTGRLNKIDSKGEETFKEITLPDSSGEHEPLTEQMAYQTVIRHILNSKTPYVVAKLENIVCKEHADNYSASFEDPRPQTKQPSVFPNPREFQSHTPKNDSHRNANDAVSKALSYIYSTKHSSLPTTQQQTTRKPTTGKVTTHVDRIVSSGLYGLGAMNVKIAKGQAIYYPKVHGLKSTLKLMAVPEQLFLKKGDGTPLIIRPIAAEAEIPPCFEVGPQQGEIVFWNTSPRLREKKLVIAHGVSPIEPDRSVPEQR